MNIEKINPNIKYVYHYTLKKNVKKILNDKAIKSKDQYVFFTKSLNDSIIAFEREMMQENKLYIDVEGNLRKREKCNKDDYCILKIPYINDNQFYTFNFENQSKESIYTLSISHKGNYKFEEAKVLEFPKNRKLNVFSKTAVALILSGIVLFPYNAYASSWLDTNNYDISWYENEEGTKYEINTAEQMAGLAHLVNNENKTFMGKNISITEDIDLTANTWETIKDIFEGTISGSICGSHRIILNYLDGKLVENKDISMVEYSYKILEDKNNLKNVVIGMPYTVEKLKLATGARAVFLNNKELSNDQSLLDLKENDTIEVFTGNYNVFIKNSKGITVPFYFESGDSIDNVKTKYSEKVNIPKNKIILKYNEKELEDERTLADYNIQKYN
ncbi:MAG: ubiquitin-like protein, partial [bacterium]|nr:ubiquitin-like protein [bacterium]